MLGSTVPAGDWRGIHHSDGSKAKAWLAMLFPIDGISMEPVEKKTLADLGEIKAYLGSENWILI